VDFRRGFFKRRNPTKEAGDPAGGKDPGEAAQQDSSDAATTQQVPEPTATAPQEPESVRTTPQAPEPAPEQKLSRRARLRRRLRVPRPRRPHLPRRQPKISHPERPSFGPLKVPKHRAELRFRLVTRIRAIRYWLREKGGTARRGLSSAAAATGAWWSRRSRGTRIRLFAVLGIVVLYLVIKFISVPGIPCEVSAAKECAPADDTIAYAPGNALLYAHLTVNSDSHQWELAEDLRDELPSFVALLQSDTSTLATPAGRPVNLPQEVLPWAKDDLALIGVPGPKKTTPEAYVVGVGDEPKANRFLASLSPGGPSKQPKLDGVTLTVYSNGLATALSGDQALFGNVLAVRGALAAKSGRTPQLEGSPLDAARDALPDVRLAEVYLSGAGARRMLAGRQGGASQLDTFVDYGATSAMAASLRVRDDGVEVHLDSRLDPTLEARSPTVFATLPHFEPSLADLTSSHTLGYVGVGELGPALNKAIATAGAGAQSLAGSLRALAQRLQKQAGVDPLKDLLPALGGQAALVAEPTETVPYASLIVDGVDEAKANQALAALERPVLRAVARGRQVPSFNTSQVGGVTVHSISVSPTVDLSYAVFDGKLVVSTQPEGIEQVRSGGERLADSNPYEDATARLPDQVSALVFLNLDEVFGLAQRAGLATDPLYASLSEDISRIGSLGLAVTGSESELRSQLFLAVHH